MTSTRVRHPILRLDVLAPDGSRASEHRVFCRLKSQSVRVEACCECVHCDHMEDGSTPSVDCSIPVRPLEHADDPDGESVEVGTLLCVGTVAVLESAAMGDALDLLRDEGRRLVAVVAPSGVLVGVVHDGVILGRRTASDMTVRSVMSSAVALHERTPVRVALRLLAASHLREATVVTKEGIPLGVFRDVDGLRWIAGTREDVWAKR